MSKRYTVTSTQTQHGPIYQIYDRLEDATLEGGFEMQKWAESICEMMNGKEVEHDSKPNSQI